MKQPRAVRHPQVEKMGEKPAVRPTMRNQHNVTGCPLSQLFDEVDDPRLALIEGSRAPSVKLVAIRQESLRNVRPVVPGDIVVEPSVEVRKSSLR
jgi:hypothetical protein